MHRIHTSKSEALYIKISWCKPPSDTVYTFNKLEHILQFLESEGKQIIQFLDANCDFNICNGTRKSMNANLPNIIKRLIDLCNSFGLWNLLRRPLAHLH